MQTPGIQSLMFPVDHPAGSFLIAKQGKFMTMGVTPFVPVYTPDEKC